MATSPAEQLAALERAAAYLRRLARSAKAAADEAAEASRRGGHVRVDLAAQRILDDFADVGAHELVKLREAFAPEISFEERMALFRDDDRERSPDDPEPGSDWKPFEL